MSMIKTEIVADVMINGCLIWYNVCHIQQFYRH